MALNALIALASGMLLAALPAQAQTSRTKAMEQDERLFSLMFDQCDPASLSAMVAEDLEFYHDKGGLMQGRQTFIDDYVKSCEAKLSPDAWRSRRELIADSLHLNPVPGLGTVVEGRHRFYERQGDGPETLTGEARFLILWRHDETGPWHLARVFSLDHRAAGPAAAINP